MKSDGKKRINKKRHRSLTVRQQPFKLSAEMRYASSNLAGGTVLALVAQW